MRRLPHIPYNNEKLLTERREIAKERALKDIFVRIISSVLLCAYCEVFKGLPVGTLNNGLIRIFGLG